ncbi:hypothetical protein BH11ACT6_BH11ACT6_35020 [soil metagenome]
MAFEVLKPARVYRLFNDADLLEVIRDHNAEPQWHVSVIPATMCVPAPPDAAPGELGLRFYKDPSDKPIDVPCDGMVIVSDLTNILSLTVDDYADAYPDNPLPED